MKFITLINQASKSGTIRWAGIFSLLWGGLIGLDWANVALPTVLEGSPWVVAGFGLLQSLMMVVKRIQTTEAISDK